MTSNPQLSIASQNVPRRLVRYVGYFLFGARLGLLNLFKNGLSLGFKKTAGKILQPINAFSRYPEYDIFDAMISPMLGKTGPMRVLDLGSPKLIGLYFAFHFDIEIVLTDINAEHIREYAQLWDCISKKARGSVSFRSLDARDIEYSDASFDVVYSMSVLEHIESAGGDRTAIEEMWRVLKSGGMLVMSVPVGSAPVAQFRRGFSYTAEHLGVGQVYFFQRIYDAATAATLRRGVLDGDRSSLAVCSHRRACWLLKGLLRLNDNARAVVGFLSPFLACLCCRVALHDESSVGGCERYGEESRRDDIYADLVVGARKGVNW